LQRFIETGVYSPQLHLKTGIAAVYSRVSAVKQKKDRDLQTRALVQCATSDGFIPKVYTDIGSGLNDRRPRFLQVLRDGVQGRYDRLYITYRDRLARFGIVSYEAILGCLDIPLICIQEKELPSLERQLVQDVIAVITSFAGKVHRSRRGTIG
jgi:putative resolvase